MGEDAFKIDICVRFSDLDVNGHVNYAAYAKYFESVRSDYFEEVLGITLIEMNTVTARLEIDYHHEIGLDEDIVVTTKVPELGNTSIPMEYKVVSDGQVKASGKTIQVVVDEETRKPLPIPNEWRERIIQFEGL